MIISPYSQKKIYTAGEKILEIKEIPLQTRASLGFELVKGMASYQELNYGIRWLDQTIGNVPELGTVVEYVKGFIGFHEFAWFTAEYVGTAESGLNSVVLANNDGTVLLPLNEPVYGTKTKSQIQAYLEHNKGAGVEHLAMVTEDIFRTLREIRKRSGIGGFEFMPSPSLTYYKNLKSREGDILSDEQIQECEELGILVDRDDQGTLLHIFTNPVGDSGCYLNNTQLSHSSKNMIFLGASLTYDWRTWRVHIKQGPVL